MQTQTGVVASTPRQTAIEMLKGYDSSIIVEVNSSPLCCEIGGLYSQGELVAEMGAKSLGDLEFVRAGTAELVVRRDSEHLRFRAEISKVMPPYFIVKPLAELKYPEWGTKGKDVQLGASYTLTTRAGKSLTGGGTVSFVSLKGFKIITSVVLYKGGGIHCQTVINGARGEKLPIKLCGVVKFSCPIAPGKAESTVEFERLPESTKWALMDSFQ